MVINAIKIKQYNSTYKHVLMVDGEPICITDGSARINECIQYIYGSNADINDGKIRKILDKYRQCYVKDTKMKKRQKEKHKAIHKFNESIA